MGYLSEIKDLAENFIHSCEKEKIELHSVLVGDREHLWLEGYWKPYEKDNRHVLFSISKSFSCMALGLLYDDGKVELHKPLIDYFPEYENLAKGYMREVTLHHILTMNAGTDEFTTGKICTHGLEDDWAANFFSDHLLHKPGTYFQYNTPGSYMLGRTVMKLCGKKPVDLLRERIFWKMGIRDVEWDECPLGCNTGGWGLWLRPVDLLKIGQLFLREGNWKGQQLLSREWIEMMNHVYSDTSRIGDQTNEGYGYQIWRNTAGGYSFRGMFGQFCYILPEKNCVFVITSGTHEKEIQGKLVEGLAAGLGDFHGKTAPELPCQLEGLSLPVLPVNYAAKAGGLCTEMLFSMSENKEGYSSIGFSLQEDRGLLYLNYEEWQGGYHNCIPFGYGKWKNGTRACKGQISFWSSGTRKTAACGQIGAMMLHLILRFTESSNGEFWDCSFEGTHLSIARHLNCGDHGDISLETLEGERIK